ncbi:hypothetical protein K5549_007135 [Capra hircus]|uniref:40S ribosomal protein S27 n=1 Tax=Capra hircus TaxID=9925 RepID=A0A452FNL5_CAPHI|nr:hypothetical protein K5549_007135 [Capra hircus]
MDLASPEEKSKHRKKQLVRSPSSYFMDVKCPGCFSVTTVFSHAETVVLRVGCCAVLCQATGGRASLQKNVPSDEAALKVPCVKMNRKPSQ